MRPIALALAILAVATKYCLADEITGIPYVDRKLCIEQNSFDLDDGISGAEVIGKSVAYLCQKECEAIAKYAADKLGVPLPPESLKQSRQHCKERATARVLKFRAEKKKLLKMERFRFSSWSYIRKKDNRVETFEAESYSITGGNLIVLRCVVSSDEKKYASGIDIRVTSVGRKFSDQDVVMLDIYLDEKPSPKRSMVWALMNERLAITLGSDAYVLAEEMKQSNYIEIKHKDWPVSLKFSLSGSAAAIGKVEKSCQSFDKGRSRG